MSYHCPGLNGPDSRNVIRPHPFQHLFANASARPAKAAAADSDGSRDTTLGRTAPQIVIPLFQRRYCWTESQLIGWWNDMLNAKRNVPGGHSVGKIIFVRQAAETLGDAAGYHPTPEVLVCVDGQQRLTTTQLLVASLRDAALERHHELAQAGQAAAGVARQALELARRLEAVLYRDVAAAATWQAGVVERVQAAAAAAQAAGGDDGAVAARVQEAWEQEFPLGNALPFATLLPSFCDRQAFFELLAGGACKHALFASGTAAGVAAARCMGVSKTASESRQGATKAHFDSAIAAHLARRRTTGAATDAPDGGDVSELAHIAQRALCTMIVMFVEILNKVNLSQVFLWLQEKTLFAAGALVYNPTPGIDFSASDMARNLCLAPFVMHLPLPEQERLYRALWLTPLELLHPGPEAMDRLLDAFIRKQFAAIDEAWRQDHEEVPQKTAPTAGAGADAGAAAGSGGEEDDEVLPLMPPPPPLKRATKRPRLGGRKGLKPGLDTAGRHRHISACEMQVFGILKAINKPVTTGDEPAQGALLYAQFQSWFEALQLARAAASPRSGSPASDEGEQQERLEAALATVDVASLVQEDVLPALAAFAAQFPRAW